MLLSDRVGCMGKIIVNDLGKIYKIYKSKKEKIMSWIFPNDEKFYTGKVVLDKINFRIASGESIGIIGMNGAGKSTLLKLITGTTKPTTGDIEISGTVSALLELGMGFHPDFTGRQNAFMAGQLLGMTSQEIENAIPEILEFSEIGGALDEPVKNYSSGMHVRLAFAIATHKRPDILIVDEALSVGDAYFQHKCFDRIKDFKRSGTTLLFVSHDAISIKNLCDRAILLHNGHVVLDAKPDDVLDYYNSLLSLPKTEANDIIHKVKDVNNGVRSGSKELIVKDVITLSEKGPSYTVSSGDKLTIQVKIGVNKLVDNFAIGISIRDKLGNVIFGTNSSLLDVFPKASKVGDELKANFIIPLLGIGPGSYSISVAVHDANSHVNGNYDWWDKAMIFEILEPSFACSSGVCYFPVHFELN